MARLFPLRSEAPRTEGTPRVVDLDGEDADAVFGALSSTTARAIYATLDEQPGTPSDVADAIDSSIQNVRYHLEKLEDAGLVEVIDTWYSSRGNEMSVYGTSNGPLIVTSDGTRAARLKQAVSRYVGGVGILAAAGLFVQAAANRLAAIGDGEPATGEGFFFAPGDDDVEEETGVFTDTEDDVEDDAELSADHQEDVDFDSNVTVDDADDVSGGEADGVGEVLVDTTLNAIEGAMALDSPGALFFLGGVAVLTVVFGHLYLREY